MPIRRLLVLPALLLASSAYAFPPCPTSPVVLVPLGRQTDVPNASPYWYTGLYELMGDTRVTDAIEGHDGRDYDPDDPKTGQCRTADTIPVPEGHSASDTVSLSPVYAPHAGYGVVGLPDLSAGPKALTVAYTLEFTIDNAAFDMPGEWIDVLQLDFVWSPLLAADQNTSASVYRVRKRMLKDGAPVLEVIEVRDADPLESGKMSAQEAIVATIAMPTKDTPAPIRLTWTQSARAPDIGTITNDGSGAATAPYLVDSILEIFDEDNSPIYTVALPGQWASTFSMGLLNYNGTFGTDMKPDEPVHTVVLQDMSLSAKTL